ncbi:hypothetical protein [Nodularia chucula]|uniref:hypothetical protein n=1 Tax=Nodularia chucula TaxID=3093667 RepID=UPI0039C5F98C
MNVTDPRLPTDEDIVNYFADIATQEARKLTDQQISEITKQAITELNHQNKNLAPRAKN